MNANVAVVVTTRNSSKTLAACLSSIKSQTAPKVRLIVVDNFSTDDTARIGRGLADHFVQAGPERSGQRNIGAKICRSEYLLFIDSDMILPSSVVEECLGRANAGSSAVIIREVSIGIGFWTACKALERACYPGDDTIESPRFIRTQLFEEVNGFDEELHAAEDWDLTARLRAAGAQISRTTTPIKHDEGHLTLRETMSCKYYYGRSMRRYMRKHPEMARRQLRLFRPAFSRHLGLLAARPGVTAGMLVMKACEMLAGALGALT